MGARGPLGAPGGWIRWPFPAGVVLLITPGPGRRYWHRPGLAERVTKLIVGVMYHKWHFINTYALWKKNHSDQSGA